MAALVCTAAPPPGTSLCFSLPGGLALPPPHETLRSGYLSLPAGASVASVPITGGDCDLEVRGQHLPSAPAWTIRDTAGVCSVAGCALVRDRHTALRGPMAVDLPCGGSLHFGEQRAKAVGVQTDPPAPSPPPVPEEPAAVVAASAAPAPPEPADPHTEETPPPRRRKPKRPREGAAIDVDHGPATPPVQAELFTVVTTGIRLSARARAQLEAVGVTVTAAPHDRPVQAVVADPPLERSIKLLCALSHCTALLSKDWLDASVAAGRPLWPPPARFEYREAVTRASFQSQNGCDLAALMAVPPGQRQRLLEGQRFFVAADVVPQSDGNDFRSVVRCAGGTVVADVASATVVVGAARGTDAGGAGTPMAVVPDDVYKAVLRHALLAPLVSVAPDPGSAPRPRRPSRKATKAASPVGATTDAPSPAPKRAPSRRRAKSTAVPRE